MNNLKKCFVLLISLLALSFAGCGGGGGGGGTSNPVAPTTSNVVTDTIVQNQVAKMVANIVGSANALDPKASIKSSIRALTELKEPGRYTLTYAPGDKVTDPETGVVETYTSGQMVISLLDTNGNLTSNINSVESILAEGINYKYAYTDLKGITHSVTNESGKLLIKGYYTAYNTAGLSLTIQNYQLSAVSTAGNYTISIPSSTFYYEKSSWPYPKNGSSLGMTVTSDGVTGTISVTFDGSKLASVSAAASGQNLSFLLDLSNGTVYQAIASQR